ncbi:hypothetical protein B0H16DRAFT_1329281, partial [Mycena metata]
SKEFDEGGVIDTLTPAEKLLIFIPATNNANEVILGGWRVHARTRSASTIYHFGVQTTYHRNNTKNFAAAKLNTEEDALFIMQLARVEDVSGVMRKFRDELLAFKQRVAEEARAKQKAKEQDAADRIKELMEIVIITDSKQLASKLKKDALRWHTKS